MCPALTVCGPFRGTSGYDRHVRYFVRHLARLGIKLELIDLPNWGSPPLPGDAKDPWFDTLDRPVGAHATLHFAMPHQVVPTAGRLNINYTMFESNQVPHHWIANNRRHDLVVVPTQSSWDAWRARGFPAERLRICPLGVDSESFRPDIEPMLLHDRRGRPISSYTTRFLNISELLPRKNLIGLLRVWLCATEVTDDAVLIIKLSHGQRDDTLRFVRAFAKMEAMISKTRDEAAPIVFIERRLPDVEMPALYAAATHYWSMSHGEGWDLPMSEAGAAGLQLIAPRHTAYESYLDDSRAWMIPAQQVPVNFSDDPASWELFRGADWWAPDEDEAVRRVAKIVRGEGARKASARPWMLRHFRWEQAARQLADIIRALHKEHGYSF